MTCRVCNKNYEIYDYAPSAIAPITWGVCRACYDMDAESPHTVKTCIPINKDLPDTVVTFADGKYMMLHEYMIFILKDTLFKFQNMHTKTGLYPVGDIETLLEGAGFRFLNSKNNNQTDGEYHKHISYKIQSMQCHANISDSTTFELFNEWVIRTLTNDIQILIDMDKIINMDLTSG